MRSRGPRCGRSSRRGARRRRDVGATVGGDRWSAGRSPARPSRVVVELVDGRGGGARSTCSLDEELVALDRARLPTSAALPHATRPSTLAATRAVRWRASRRTSTSAAPPGASRPGPFDPALPSAPPHPREDPWPHSPTPTSSSSRPSARRSASATAASPPCTRPICSAPCSGAAIERSGIDPASIGQVIGGCVEPGRRADVQHRPHRVARAPACRSRSRAPPSTASAARRSRPPTSRPRW